MAKPYSVLQNAQHFGSYEHAQKIVYRVLDDLNGSYDSVGVGNALVEALEGPGMMPGLVEVTGGTGEWYGESRNIYEERGEPFTLENLCSLLRELVDDPEYFFWDVRYRYVTDVPAERDPDNEETREVTIMFNCFFVTQYGFEFAQYLFPERMEALRKLEESRKG